LAIIDDQLKQVFRRLARTPLFTTITLLTLAIGIGANTVVFSVVDGVLLKPLNYPHPEQLIGISHSAPAVNLPAWHRRLHVLHPRICCSLRGKRSWFADGREVENRIP
jgi:hypothetical protein